MLKWTAVGLSGTAGPSRSRSSPPKGPPVPSRPPPPRDKDDTLEPGGGLLDRILAGWSQRKRSQRSDNVPRRKSIKDRKATSVKTRGLVKAKSKGNLVYTTPARRRLVLSDVSNHVTPTTTTASDSSPNRNRPDLPTEEVPKSSHRKRPRITPKSNRNGINWERMYTKPKPKDQNGNCVSESEMVGQWHGSQKSLESGKSEEVTSQEKDTEEDEDKENSENWDRLSERRRRRKKRESRRKSDKREEMVACATSVIGCSSYAATVSTSAATMKYSAFYSNCKVNNDAKDNFVSSECQNVETPKRARTTWEELKHHAILDMNKFKGANLNVTNQCPSGSLVNNCDNYSTGIPLITLNSDARFHSGVDNTSLSSAFTMYRSQKVEGSNRLISSHYPDSAFVPYIPSQTKSSMLSSGQQRSTTLPSFSNPGYTSSSTLTSSEAVTHGSYYPNPNIYNGAHSTQTGTSSGIASSTCSSTKSVTSSCGPNSTLSSSCNPEIHIEYSPNEDSYRSSILQLSQRLYQGSITSSPFIHPLLPPVAPSSLRTNKLRRRLTDDFDAPPCSGASSISGNACVSPLARDLAWMQLDCARLSNNKKNILQKLSTSDKSSTDDDKKTEPLDRLLHPCDIIKEDNLEIGPEDSLPACPSCSKNKHPGLESSKLKDNINERETDYKPPVAPRTNVDCRCVREKTGYCNLVSSSIFASKNDSPSKKVLSATKRTSVKLTSSRMSCARLPSIKTAKVKTQSTCFCSCPVFKCTCLIPPPPQLPLKTDGYSRIWDATTLSSDHFPQPSLQGHRFGHSGLSTVSENISRPGEISRMNNMHKSSLLIEGITPPSPFLNASVLAKKKGKRMEVLMEDGKGIESVSSKSSDSFVVNFKKSSQSDDESLSNKPVIGAGLCFPLPSSTHHRSRNDSISSNSSVTSSCPPSPSPSPVRRRPRIFRKHDTTDPKFLEKLNKGTLQLSTVPEPGSLRRRRMSGNEGGRDRKRSRRSQSQDGRSNVTPKVKSAQKRTRRRSSSVGRCDRADETLEHSLKVNTSSTVCPVISGYPAWMGVGNSYHNVATWVLEGDEEPDHPSQSLSGSLADIRNAFGTLSETISGNNSQKPWYAKLDDSVGSDSSKGKLGKNGSFLIPPSSDICDISTCHCKSPNNSRTGVESERLSLEERVIANAKDNSNSAGSCDDKEAFCDDKIGLNKINIARETENVCDTNIKNVAHSSRKRQLSEGGMSGLVFESIVGTEELVDFSDVKHRTKKETTECCFPPPLPPHGAKQHPPPVPPPPIPPHHQKKNPPPVPPHLPLPTPPPPPKPPASVSTSTSLPLLLTRLSLSQISLKRKSSCWSIEAIDGDEDDDQTVSDVAKKPSTPVRHSRKPVVRSPMRRGHSYPTVSSRLSPAMSPSPQSSSDGETWNSHHMHFMKTPKLSHEHVIAGTVGSKGSQNSDESDVDALETASENSVSATPVVEGAHTDSPLALVERRSRSRKCLLFASPGVINSSKKRVIARRSTLKRSAPVKGQKPSESKGRGDLEVAIYNNNGLLTVHVIQAKNLRKDADEIPYSAYVKVSLVPMGEDRTYHRTPHVQPQAQSSSESNSSSVSTSSLQGKYIHRFDHKFSFEILPTDHTRRVLVSVWSTGGDKRRSHFLGCTSFAVKNAVKKDIRGAFRLLSQSTGRLHNVPAFCSSSSMATGNRAEDTDSDSDDDDTDELNFSIEEDSRRGSVIKKVENKDTNGYAMDIGRASTSRDVGALASTSGTAPGAVLEDNSFLRHLELEAEGEDDEEEGSTRVRLARKGPVQKGRTPFTTTRKLAKSSGGSGFGFSVAWTQPPRIERVESGQPADKAGLRAGDLVIFVGEKNVVTLPEDEILSLIRSCGDHLTLEVYRRITPNGVVGAGSTSRLSTSATLPTHRMRAAGSPIPRRPMSFPGEGHVSEGQETGEESAFDGDISGGSGAGGDGARRRPRRLQLPHQVTFNAESSGRGGPGGFRSLVATDGPPLSAEEGRRRAALQLVGREQSFALTMHFGVSRFLRPLSERRDLITTQEHQVLFQNAEELLTRTEDLLDQLVQDDAEILGNCIGRVYLKKVASLSSCYGRYCSGLKQADCLLAQKSRSQEFLRHVMEPAIPRRRPDLTAFIHKPLQHFREVLKLLQTILNNTKVNDEDYTALSKVVQDFQATYREITVGGGIMEPDVEGRPPLLSLQDLESRLVFTRCKPFILNSGGRQWIFGGDLSRVDGRSVRPYWALLFTDLLLLAKVSRDRVLFVTEEPIPLLNVTRAFFNIRKKDTEFRLLLDSGGGKNSFAGSVGGLASTSASVTTTSSGVPHSSSSAASTASTVQAAPSYCSSSFTLPLQDAPGALGGGRTGLRMGVGGGNKGRRRRSVILRAPTPELKAVWTNLLQRQIIFLNTARGGTPSGSPLDSPDPYSHPSLLGNAANLSQQQLERRQAGIATDVLARHSEEEEVEEDIHLPKDLHQDKLRYHNGGYSGGTKLVQSPSGSIPSPGRRILEDYIDQKCRLLGKSRSSRGSAIHLQQWIRGQLGGTKAMEEVENVDDLGVVWSPETLRRRSEELRLNATAVHRGISPGRHCDSRCEDVELSDTDGSPSRSTDDSQVTVKSTSGNATAKEDLSQKAVSVCRQCHETCLNNRNGSDSDRKGDGIHRPCSSSAHHLSHQQKDICANVTKGNDEQTLAQRELTAEERAINAVAAAVEGEVGDEDEEEEEDWKSVVPTLPSSSKDSFIPKSKEKTESFSKDLAPSSKGANKTEKGMNSKDSLTSKSRMIPKEISIEEVPSEENVIDNGRSEKHLNADSGSNLVCIPLPVIEVQPPTPDSNRTVIEGGSEWGTKEEIKEGEGEEDGEEKRGSVSEGELPYKSLSSGLKKYGTLNSLERVGTDDEDEDEEEEEGGEGAEEEEEETESSGSGGEGKSKTAAEEENGGKALQADVIEKEETLSEEGAGTISVGAVRQSLRGWTSRAGSFVAEKMQLFERLSEEARSTAFLDRYLRTSLEEVEEIETTTIVSVTAPNGVRPSPSVQVHVPPGSASNIVSRSLHPTHHHSHQTSCLLPYGKRGSMSDPPSSPSPEDVTPPSGETTDREDAWGTPTSGEMEFFSMPPSTTTTMVHSGGISSGFGGGGGESLAALASSSHWLPGNGDDEDDNDDDDDDDNGDDDLVNDDDEEGVELADDVCLVGVDGVSASMLSVIAPPRGIFPRRRLEPLPEEEEPPTLPQAPKQLAPKPPVEKSVTPKAPPRKHSTDSNGTSSDQGTASAAITAQRPERRRRRRGGASLGGLSEITARAKGTTAAQRECARCEGDDVFRSGNRRAILDDDDVGGASIGMGHRMGRLEGVDGGSIRKIRLGRRRGWPKNRQPQSLRGKTQRLLGFLSGRRNDDADVSEEAMSGSSKILFRLFHVKEETEIIHSSPSSQDRRFWKQLKRRRNGAMAVLPPPPTPSTSTAPMYVQQN